MVARELYISPKVLWQVLSGGRVAITFVGSLLPEDPTWTAAIVGVGLTATYFALRTRETSSMLQQETIQDIVESAEGHFCPREELDAYIGFHLHTTQGRALVVTGPKNSGATLLVCTILSRCTFPLDNRNAMAKPLCPKQIKELKTSTRISMRARCFVGTHGLISELRTNLQSTKFEAVITFVRNLFSSFQGSGVSLDELREMGGVGANEEDETVLLDELKKSLKMVTMDITPSNHVLFLDNIERFVELSASWPDPGRHAIKILLDSVKMLTRSCRKMHAVCGGTPVFCYDVLHSVHCKDYFDVCFVGDMSYANASRLYTKLVSCLLPKDLQVQALDQDLFSDVFQIVGGRVGDIQDMVIHFGTLSRASSAVATQFPKLARQKTRLHQILSGYDSKHEVDTSPPEWTPKQVSQVLLATCRTGNSCGCVSLQDAIHIVGDPKVLRSMLEHEVLIYRPQFPLHEDFEGNKYSDYVAPYSPLDLYCLRNYLMAELNDLASSATE